MRQLQIRLVKTPKTDTEIVLNPTPKIHDVTNAIERSVNKTLKTIGVLAIGYVVLDTARQILIAKANQPQ